jgi:hypothetical protein
MPAAKIEDKDLLPCIFCSSYKVTASRYTKAGQQTYAVTCFTCDARGPSAQSALLAREAYMLIAMSIDITNKKLDQILLDMRQV